MRAAKRMPLVMKTAFRIAAVACWGMALMVPISYIVYDGVPDKVVLWLAVALWAAGAALTIAALAVDD